MTAAMPEMEAASCEHREILGVERVLDQSSRSEFSKGRKPLPCAPLAAVRILQTYAERGVPLAPRAAGTSLSGAAIGPGVIVVASWLDAIRACYPLLSGGIRGAGSRTANPCEQSIAERLSPGALEKG